MDEAMQKEARKIELFDVKRVRAFQELLRTDGWKYLTELLNSNIERGMVGVFDRPEGDANIRAQDFDRGRCAGLIFARDLPGVTIAAFDQTTSDPASEEN